DQTVINRILMPVHCLQAAGTIHMSNCRKQLALVFADWVHLLHERIRRGIDEVVGNGFFCNRWSKRTELFTELDFGIDQVAHVGTSRVCQNAPIAERSGTPFHPSLKPANDVAVRQQASGSRTSFLARV